MKIERAREKTSHTETINCKCFIGDTEFIVKIQHQLTTNRNQFGFLQLYSLLQTLHCTLWHTSNNKQFPAFRFPVGVVLLNSKLIPCKPTTKLQPLEEKKTTRMHRTLSQAYIPWAISQISIPTGFRSLSHIFFSGSGEVL